jgi:hypothetical protein
MKYSTLSKSILALLLVLSLVLGMNVQTNSWKSFSFATRQWINTTVSLFSSPTLLPDAKAALNGWQSWPKSHKHKGFDGGWIMPFELFDTKLMWNGEVVSIPISVDLNGDSLQDLIYSRAIYNYQSWPNSRDHNHVEQYILLRRHNGFAAAYRCVIDGAWYYGDCADMQYSGSDPEMYYPWFPILFFWQQASLNWEGKPVPKVNGFNLNSVTGGTTYPTFDYKPLSSRPANIVNGQIFDIWLTKSDAKQPRLQDINGDGLIDVYFFGNYTHFATNSTRPTSHNLSYIFLNTGRGLVPAHICVDYPFFASGNMNGYELEFNMPIGQYCY